LCGLGGQGIITAGHLIGQAATLYDRKDALMTEDYSPYITGGWSKADLVISDEPIDYPLVKQPDILVAMSQEAYDTHEASVKDSGLILVDRNLVTPKLNSGKRIIEVPAVAIADALGNRVVANIAMLGAFAESTGVLSQDSVKRAILTRFPKAAKLNEDAFEKGRMAIVEATSHG
jgi:2-oxoglutarate ferredoxin oxidoreductase subunit gamma